MTLAIEIFTAAVCIVVVSFILALFAACLGIADVEDSADREPVEPVRNLGEFGGWQG